MRDATGRVLESALELEDGERALLARELVASLDGTPDPGADAAWGAEIRKRMAEIEHGTVELEDFDAATDEIERALPK